MPEILEIPLSAVNEWLKEETTSIIEPIREAAKRILQDIQEKLEEHYLPLQSYIVIFLH